MAAPTPKLHWHPEPKMRKDGKWPTHCGVAIGNPQLITDDADKVIASENGCTKCQFTKGFPDLEPLKPHSMRMAGVARGARDLILSAREENRKTIPLKELEELFRKNNIML